MQLAQGRLPDLDPNGRVPLLPWQTLMWLPVTGSLADRTNATFDAGGTCAGDATGTPKKTESQPTWHSQDVWLSGLLTVTTNVGLDSACASVTVLGVESVGEKPSTCLPFNCRPLVSIKKNC